MTSLTDEDKATLQAAKGRYAETRTFLRGQNTLVCPAVSEIVETMKSNYTVGQG